MSRFARQRVPSFLVLAAAAAACAAPGDGGDWDGTVEDSAGVAVVRNGERGLWSDATAWRVSEELRIGAAEGDPNLQFAQIVHLDVGSDGSVYVLDQSAQRVQVFDAEGAYVRTLGRPGSGPGEFSPATTAVLVAAGDTVLVPDMMQQRASRFAPDGAHAGDLSIPVLQGVPVRWSHAPDGALVEQTRVIPMPNAPGGADSSSGVIRRRDGAGRVRDTLLVLPRSESFTVDGNRASIRLFAPEPLWTILSDGRLAVAMNDRYRIQLYEATAPLPPADAAAPQEPPAGSAESGSEAELDRVVAAEVEPSPVSEADRELLRERMREMLAQSGAPPEAVRMMTSSLEFAERFPALSDLQGGPDGTLWVQRVRPVEEMDLAAGGMAAFEMGAAEWDVYDREGRLLGVVTLPDRFRPIRFVGDRIYGVQRDDLDVQYVVRLRIERPAAGA